MERSKYLLNYNYDFITKSKRKTGITVRRIQSEHIKDTNTHTNEVRSIREKNVTSNWIGKH